MHTYIWYVPRFNPPSDAEDGAEKDHPAAKIAVAHLVLARLQMAAPPLPPHSRRDSARCSKDKILIRKSRGTPYFELLELSSTLLFCKGEDISYAVLL